MVHHPGCGGPAHRGHSHSLQTSEFVVKGILFVHEPFALELEAEDVAEVAQEAPIEALRSSAA